MGRPNITMLNLPPNSYRPDFHAFDFESRKAAQDEDRIRVEKLNAIKHGGEFGRRARDLAERLANSNRRAPTQSPACKLYMRDQRLRIFGHLWKLIDETTEPVSTFTVVKRGWLRFPESLDDLDLKALLNAFRQDLYRCGAAGASGYLFAAIDGEFWPPSHCYQTHLHGVVSGGMIAVLDKLRARPGYRPWIAAEGAPGCAQPIVISRKPLTNLPSSIGYGMKGFWKVECFGRTTRIPEPFGSQVLIYLDQYTLADLTILVKLSVSNGGLVRTANETDL